MSFDINFFNELRTLTGAVLAPIRPDRYRPSVPEIHMNGGVSNSFLITTCEFVRELYQTSRHREQFAIEFRANQESPRHIYNYTKGKAFRKQLNVGFSAGNNEDDDCVRIGLEFSLNQNRKAEGVADYNDFFISVSTNPSHFDTTFAALGSYGEPNHIFSPRLSSTIVLGDSPNFDEDWRFYGKLLYFRSNQSLISNMSSFVNEVINVFNHIRNTGYYP